MAKPEAPVLETERLRLRRRQHRDIPRMMQAYQDDEIRRYLGGHPPKDGAMLAQLAASFVLPLRCTRWLFR